MSDIGNLLVPSLIGCHANALPQDMPQSLRALAQLIERHDRGNRHFDNIVAQLDFPDLFLPRLDFRFRIRLFCKPLNLLGVERQGSLSATETVIDSLATFTEALPGISRTDLLPEYEIGHGTDLIAGIVHLAQLADGVVTGFMYMLEHSVDMELVEVLDKLLQGPDYLG